MFESVPKPWANWPNLRRSSGLAIEQVLSSTFQGKLESNILHSYVEKESQVLVLINSDLSDDNRHVVSATERPASCLVLGLNPDTVAHLRNEGEAASISYYCCSWIMQHAFDNPTEIIATKGVLKINQHPRSNLIDIVDEDGIHKDICDVGRYERAFVNELNSFAASVLDSQPLPCQLSSAMEIAQALQKSLVTGQKISSPKQ
jgi:predicted dehydrogenase